MLILSSNRDNQLSLKEGSSQVALSQKSEHDVPALTMFTRAVSSLGLLAASVAILAASVAILAVLLERTLPDADVSIHLKDLPKRKRHFFWIPSTAKMKMSLDFQTCVIGRAAAATPRSRTASRCSIERAGNVATASPRPSYSSTVFPRLIDR